MSDHFTQHTLDQTNADRQTMRTKQVANHAETDGSKLALARKPCQSTAPTSVWITVPHHRAPSFT
jgi:hypothetical protein